jgi:hypothetical protein
VALALAEPLASVELLLARSDSLPAVLQPVLGLVDVDLFGALPPGDGRAGGGGVVGAGGPVRGRTSASRDAGRPRAATIARATPRAAGAGAPEFERALGDDRDAVPSEVDAAATADSLLDRLADEALEALAEATRNAQGGSLRTRFGRTAMPGPMQTVPRAQTHAPSHEQDTTAVSGPAVADVLDPAVRGSAARSQRGGPARHGEPSPTGALPPATRALERSPRARLVAIEAGAATGDPPSAARLAEAEPGGLVGATLLGSFVDSALSRAEPSPFEPTALSDAPGFLGTRALDVLFPPAPPWTSEPESAGEEARTAPEPPIRPVHSAAPGAAATPPPQDLAWLVNEALVEQARRHGVDLS